MAPRRRPPSHFDARSQSRERALTLLYEADTKGIDGRAVLSGLVDDPDSITALIVGGVTDLHVEIDAIITTYADGWSLERMPCLDRNILRMGTFELMRRPEIPQAVILDEAVELAKTFSTDNSGRYVNGVLSAVAKMIRVS